jgi:hypothetical protein
MTRLILLGLVALSLTGCATAYGPVGITGGYRSDTLAEDRYRVQFLGNGFSDSETAEDYALLRGAELCQTAGYGYMRVTSKHLLTTEMYMSVNYGPANHIADAPTMSIEVQCSYDPESKSIAVASYIEKTRKLYFSGKSDTAAK